MCHNHSSNLNLTTEFIWDVLNSPDSARKQNSYRKTVEWKNLSHVVQLLELQEIFWRMLLPPVADGSVKLDSDSIPRATEVPLTPVGLMFFIFPHIQQFKMT